MKFRARFTITFSRLAVVFLLICGTCISTGLSADVFTIPENLKDNVAFWKKIYTEVSVKEGVVHHSEYPLIIYKSVTLGNLRGRKRSRFIRQHFTEVKQWLRNIAAKQETQWTAKEQEIAELFRRYASIEEVKSAVSRVRFQQGQRERFKKGLERSGAYLGYIFSVFQKHKIPQRIAYLPHVESSFNINAYSRVGAAGMWQFMRSTGRLFLTINYRVDERRDPFKATVAASKLLRKNYSELKSWPLAITAYNHGLVSMKRAVKVTGSRDLGVIIDKYKNRRFKFASKNFYGCFLAASEIAANPEKYFSGLTYHSPWHYNEIQLKNYFRPRTLSKHLGISEKQLEALNPSIRPIVFRRQLSIPRGYRLRIPASLSPQAADEKLAAIPGSVKKSIPVGQSLYTVRQGDTLYSISRMFEVSTESLIIANEIPRENRIYIGQVIRIPGRGKEKGKDKIVKKIGEAKTAPASSPPPSSSSTSSVEVVPPLKPEPGDPGPVAEKLPEPYLIFPKEEETAFEGLIVKTPLEAFDATLYNLDVKVSSSKNQAVVTVSIDETFTHYADWLDTSVRKIRHLNRWRRSVRLNQKIRIPLKNQLQSLELFKTRRLEYHMALEEDFYTQYRVVDIRLRKVRYGDTLWSICIRDEEIPIWLFKKYNRDIDIESLKVNMELRIPVLAAIGNGSNNN